MSRFFERNQHLPLHDYLPIYILFRISLILSQESANTPDDLWETEGNFIRYLKIALVKSNTSSYTSCNYYLCDEGQHHSLMPSKLECTETSVVLCVASQYCVSTLKPMFLHLFLSGCCRPATKAQELKCEGLHGSIGGQNKRQSEKMEQQG